MATIRSAVSPGSSCSSGRNAAPAAASASAQHGMDSQACALIVRGRTATTTVVASRSAKKTTLSRIMRALDRSRPAGGRSAWGLRLGRVQGSGAISPELIPRFILLTLCAQDPLGPASLSGGVLMHAPHRRLGALQHGTRHPDEVAVDLHPVNGVTNFGGSRILAGKEHLQSR